MRSTVSHKNENIKLDTIMKINLTLSTLTMLGLMLGISSISFANGYYVNSTIPNRSVAVASQNSKFDLDSSKISIGGLKLDININKVRKILGIPLQQQQKVLTDDDGVCGAAGSYHIKLKYSKTEVSLVGKTPNSAVVYNVTTSNPSFATSEGIRVGNSVVKAKKAYAKYESRQKEDELIYGEVSTLRLKANNSRITQINLNYDSCY